MTNQEAPRDPQTPGYHEALDYLHGLQRFGMKPGLDRTAALLQRLGRPDRRAGRIVHITGTSGKGSVASMVESGLRAAGFRVGLYTSPELQRFTERMQVNRVEITEAEVAGLVAEVAPHVEAMLAEGLEQPTEFEVITSMALLWFARQQVDYLVLEVGLGGRFDATTAVEAPVLTAITNIGLDHTQWLGKTHEEIAWDKAGLIKPAVPCVTGTEHPGALEVIRRVAREQDAVLVEVAPEDAVVTAAGPGDGWPSASAPVGQLVDLLGSRGWYRGVHLALLGRHQAANAAVALRMLELLGVGEKAIRTGLAQVVWPGRLELLITADGKRVLLDAAHNPAKCAALAEAVRELFPDRRILLLLGVLADKEVEAMVEPLLGLADAVWATTPKSRRAMGATELSAICLAHGHRAEPVDPLPEALRTALAATGPDDLLLVTGSFYTVGPVRNLLVRL